MVEWAIGVWLAIGLVCLLAKVFGFKRRGG